MSFYRNLEVPYFSQRENKTVWHERYTSNDDNDMVKKNPSLIGTIVPNGRTDSKAKNSCNITCLAMMLHYFGVTSDTPDEMMRKVFDPSASELTTYSDGQKKLVAETYTNGGFFESVENMQKFAKEFYNAKSEVWYWKTFGEIKNDILVGYPALVSVGLLNNYDESFYKKNLQSDKGIQNIKNYAYHLYAKVALSSVKKNDYDNKNSELESKIKTLEETLKKESIAKEEKRQTEKEIKSVKQNLDRLKKCKAEGYQYCLDELRSHGHYIVIRGIDETGVIINDPWGKPVINTKGKGEYYTIMNGDNIHLDQEEFDKQYFQDKHFYSCLIIRAKRWNFISHNKQFDLNNENFLRNCHEAEIFEHGGFPIKRSNLWHNGLHFGNKIGTHIYPIGLGQLIAARIVNKDVGDDKAPMNGSRCFVLIKHQVKVDTVLKDFFVCYMHLKPIIIDEYPENKTGIKWIDDILERSKSRKRVSASLSVKDREFYEVDDIAGTRVVGRLPNSGVFAINEEKENEKKNGKIYFYYEKGNTLKEYWTKTTWEILDAEDKTLNYKDKVEELKTGKVVYFTDIPEDNCIEVSNSCPVGFMGSYSGLSCDNEADSIHIEIFSNSLIVDKSDTNFKIIKKSDMPLELNSFSSLCNRQEMINFFENKNLYENGIKCFLNLKKDGVICKSEMINFYNNYEYSKIFESYIVQHISEWSDKIDWESSIKNAKGVPNKYFLEFLPKNEDYVGTLKEYVDAVYNPYKWFNNECISAMKTEDSDLKKGLAYFYHPSRFIKWLYDNDK